MPSGTTDRWALLRRRIAATRLWLRIIRYSVLWRNLCRNLIIIDRSEQTMAVRHVGPNLGNVVSAGIERALEKVSHFADRWSEATVENVLERYGVDDVATIFRALVSTGPSTLRASAPTRWSTGSSGPGTSSLATRRRRS